MLKFGNREFRNLQEQVLKNMCDIQDIEQGATVLAAFGIKVVGQVNQASDLPAPTTYKGNLGDAFLVGTEAPYDYYIYAKAYDGQEQPAFYNLGQFPQPGPKGDKGDAAGFGTVSATATSVVGQPTVSVSTSGTNEAKNIAFEFGIPDVNPEYVEANPTAEATGTLQKLRVDNTVYGLGGGGTKLYKHCINLEHNKMSEIRDVLLVVVNTSSASMSFTVATAGATSIPNIEDYGKDTTNIVSCIAYNPYMNQVGTGWLRNGTLHSSSSTMNGIVATKGVDTITEL